MAACELYLSNSSTIPASQWNTYVFGMFLRHLFLEVTLVVSLTIDALTHGSIVDKIDGESKAWGYIGYIPMIISIIIWLYFARHELKEMSLATSIRAYVADFWNVLDIISLFSIFTAYTFRFLEGIFGAVGNLQGDGNVTYYWSTTALAFALPMTYLNTLYYLQGFNSSGQLIRMILGIIKGGEMQLVEMH